MATLKDAGYGAGGVEGFTRSADLIGKTFVITDMAKQTTKLGEAFLTQIQGPDGPQTTFFGITAGRQKMVDYLAANPGQVIGPVKLVKEGRFYTFLDVAPELAGEPDELNKETGELFPATTQTPVKTGQDEVPL